MGSVRFAPKLEVVVGGLGSDQFGHCELYAVRSNAWHGRFALNLRTSPVRFALTRGRLEYFPLL